MLVSMTLNAAGRLRFWQEFRLWMFAPNKLRFLLDKLALPLL